MAVGVVVVLQVVHRLAGLRELETEVVPKERLVHQVHNQPRPSPAVRQVVDYLNADYRRHALGLQVFVLHL